MDFGNVKAMLNLGNMYEKGKGVPKSYEEAMYYYTMAGN